MDFKIVMRIVTFLFLVIFLVKQKNALDTSLLATCTSSCGIGCLQCLNNTCSSCQPGYFLNNQICTTYSCNISACTLCNQKGECIKCQDLYSVYNPHNRTCDRTCHLQNCATCKQDSNSCELCSTGYTLYTWDGTCIPQPIGNCLKVHDWRKKQFQCSLCQNHYKPSTDQAVCISDACPSVSNCQSCSSSSICDTCRPGFSFVSSSCVANSCGVANCLYCDLSGACIRCASGYSLSSNQCIKQDCSLANCASCKPGSIFCDACSPGFVYNVWNKQCEKLTSSPQPLNCESYSRTNSIFFCINCLNQFIFASQNHVSCVKLCPSNCTTCINSTFCSQCNLGYQLSNGTCQLIPCTIAGCSLCHSNGTCLLCADPYSIYNSTSASCVRWCPIPNCQLCRVGSDKCERCSDGFALYQLTDSCIFSPILNCLQIFDWRDVEFVCSLCIDSFLPAKNQIECLPIQCSTMENCLYCSNSSVCTHCQAGYTLFNNSCVHNPCNLSNCLACNQQGSCVRSVSSYYIMSSQLVAKTCEIANCKVCKPNSIYCDSCREGFSYNIWSKECEAPQGKVQSQDSSSQLKYLWFLLLLAGIVAVIIVVKVTRDRQEELRVQTENQKIKDKRQLPYLENPPMLHVIKNSPFVEPNSQVSSEECPSTKIQSKFPPLKLPSIKPPTISLIQNNTISRPETFRSDVAIERSEIQIKLPTMTIKKPMQSLTKSINN